MNYYGFDDPEYQFGNNRTQSEAQSKTKLRPESAKVVRLPSAKQTKPPVLRPTSAQVPKLMRQTDPLSYGRKGSRNNEPSYDENPLAQPIYEEDVVHFNEPRNMMDFNNILVQPPNYPSQENRKLPKNIKKDKEKLYEEVLDMKQLLNRIKEENTRLKTRNLTLQKENSKLEHLLGNAEEYLNSGNAPQPPVKDHLMMKNFKKQMKELKMQLVDKDAELMQLKRNVKVTKMEEVDAELKNYIDECIRLRSLLDQALRNINAVREINNLPPGEEKYYIQMKIINSLHQEIDSFHSMLTLKEEEIFNLQVTNERTNTELARLALLLKEANESIDNRDKRIEQLERDNANVKSLNNNLIIKASKAHHDEMLIRDLEGRQEDVKRNMQERDKKIDLLEKEIKDMKANYSEAFTSQERERKHLETEMERYKILYEQTDEKYKQNLFANVTAGLHEERPRTRVEQQHAVQSVAHHQKSESEPKLLMQQAQQVQLRRRRTVKYEDVRDIGLSMNMRFRIQRLKLEEIVSRDLMDPLIINKGNISIREIAVRLSNAPFLLSDVEQIYLVARYLVEDNTQDWVEYNEDRTQNVSIVKSIFLKLVGRCRIYSEEEEAKIREEIVGHILKYRKSIVSYFPTFNDVFLTRDQIVLAFGKMGLELSADALDYFFLRMFELGGQLDVKVFDYRKILEEWGKDEDKRTKKNEKSNQRGSQYFNINTKFSFDKN